MGLVDLAKEVLLPGVPRHLSDNFRQLDDSGAEELDRSLREHYFTRQIWGDAAVDRETYLASAEGTEDAENHLWNRLRYFRREYIPWFDSVRPLAGARVLEIGCGTGASTVVLAEQGAQVTALDVDGSSLRVARDRLRLYGVEARLLEGNAATVHELLDGERFDLIIFFATLEHLTHDERMAAMRGTWGMLEPGGLWAVVETPNRLWYHDDHTSQLPFFHWLPDDLAIKYSAFSPTRFFNEAYRGAADEEMEGFLRHGRGVSFHEFDLALGLSTELDVVSSLW